MKIAGANELEDIVSVSFLYTFKYILCYQFYCFLSFIRHIYSSWTFVNVSLSVQQSACS